MSRHAWRPSSRWPSSRCRRSQPRPSWSAPASPTASAGRTAPGTCTRLTSLTRRGAATPAARWVSLPLNLDAGFVLTFIGFVLNVVDRVLKMMGFVVDHDGLFSACTTWTLHPASGCWLHGKQDGPVAVPCGDHAQCMTGARKGTVLPPVPPPVPPAPTPHPAPGKNDEFCIKNDEFCIKYEELCIQK